MILVVALVAVGGGIVGAALTGVIDIPGLTPKKGKHGALYGEGGERLYTETTAKAPPKPPPPPKRPAEPEEDLEPIVVVDPAQGAKKLATLWMELPAEKVRDLSKDWPVEDLASVLVAMDEEKAAKIIALLDASRASKLSREIQRISSKVPTPAGQGP